MFVELLGLPASGKSTLFKACKSSLTMSGRSVGSAADLDTKDTSLPGYFRRNPVTRALYRSEQLRSEYPECVELIDRTSSGQQNARALLYSSLVRQLICAANPDAFEVVMIDEGGIHRFIHLLVNSSPSHDDLLDRYCDLAPLPDAVVYLKLDPAVSHERALARLAERDGGKQPLEQLERRINAAHGGAEVLRLRADLMERALERIRAKGCEIIRVDATDEPVKVGNTVSGVLNDALSHKQQNKKSS